MTEYPDKINNEDQLEEYYQDLALSFPRCFYEWRMI
jgi:hypothetical protein